MINIVLFGAPGCGKGTQAQRLKAHYGIEHVSTGEVIRDEIRRGTELGRSMESYIKAGKLAPDEIVIGMVANYVSEHKHVKGCIFDGFPRTIPQAQALLDAGIPLDFVLEISVPDAEIVERMSGRRVDPVSGRTYHIKYNPPKVEGKDDVTGDPLVQRDDDREEVVLKRLGVYHNQTEALVGFYGELAKSGKPGAPQYRSISGIGSIDTIRERVFEALR